MNTNYIYDIFETCKKNDLPDLILALAHHKDTAPVPDGMTEDGISQFIGRHYDALVEAYQTGDKAEFAQVVAACEKADQENEEA